MTNAPQPMEVAMRVSHHATPDPNLMLVITGTGGGCKALTLNDWHNADSEVLITDGHTGGDTPEDGNPAIIGFYVDGDCVGQVRIPEWHNTPDFTADYENSPEFYERYYA